MQRPETPKLGRRPVATGAVLCSVVPEECSWISGLFRTCRTIRISILRLSIDSCRLMCSRPPLQLGLRLHLFPLFSVEPKEARWLTTSPIHERSQGILSRTAAGWQSGDTIGPIFIRRHRCWLAPTPVGAGQERCTGKTQPARNNRQQKHSLQLCIFPQLDVSE